MTIPTADSERPQGLKSDPGVDNPYTHIGFNPAPGSTHLVRDVHRHLTSCAKEMEKTHSKVTKLMDGSYWEGDAAVAFREKLQDGPLPINLKNGTHSVHKAAKQLDLWLTELEDFQRRAKKLDGEAKHAREALERARGHADKAKNAPALDKGKGRDYDDAHSALTKANTVVKTAQEDLDDVLRRARSLATEHEDTARKRARHISDATHKLAPHEPSAWDTFTDWAADNLPDILSACAAVLGAIALLGLTVVAPWVLFLAAGLLSGVAFGLRLSDPEVMASLKDGLTKGEMDVEFWSNALGVAGDFLGMLPGLGAVFKGLMKTPELMSTMSRAVGEADEVLTLGQKVARAGSLSWSSIKTTGTSIRTEAAAAEGAVNILAHPRVLGGRLAPIVEKIDKPATYLGAGTAVYGVASSLVSSLDSDGAKTATNLLDGPRTLGIDLPATVGALHFFISGAGEAS
ncbi:putative T7SS-secreted protein [Streptomyces sp. 7R007]